MSVFTDYQTTPLKDLFNIQAIEQTLTQVDTATPQQEAVLKFIINNPNEQFIQLQKTFTMPDHLVADLVLEYGTPSEEYDKIRDLRQKMRSKSNQTM